MAGSVNKVILVGNLGRDPEVRYAQSGRQDRQSVGGDVRKLEGSRKSGERREKTEWHRVVIFNDRLADVAEQYLAQGLQGLPRRPTPDPQMDRQRRYREIHHGSRAAALSRRADHARYAGRRRWRWWRLGRRRPGRRRLRWPVATSGGFGGGGGPSGQSGGPSGGDLDDEIPF